MFSKIVLALWSGAGLTWWILAWRLVTADQRKKGPEPASRQTLSVFKPLPPLGASGLKVVAGGLESFAAQLDPESELLLGIHEADRDAAAPFVKRLRADYPEARIKVVFRSEPDDVANPKIAWQKILAPHAEGELWLWSDADIIAPPGFLQAARLEYARRGAAMVTFPYVIREIPLPPALLDALFVNVEFYPGVLLLRQLGPVDFGLGAAMLFQRDDFLRQVDWDEIGAWLADDFILGRKLRPVRIGTTTLATVPGAATWGDALAHDLRWTKTIRWNRPVGSFARLLIMPVLGWLVAVALHPSHFFAWLGLLGMIQAEVLFAAAICRRAGCPLKIGSMLSMEVWSLWRILLWFLCWLPWPVRWSGKVWWGPRVNFNHEMNDQPQKEMAEAVDKLARKSDLLKQRAQG
jgi:ceramide glucosyltransferase